MLVNPDGRAAFNPLGGEIAKWTADLPSSTRSRRLVPRNPGQRPRAVNGAAKTAGR